VPPASYEVLAEPLEVLDDRQRVHDRQARHDVRMVQRGACGDQAAAVVPDDREAIVSEHPHRRDHVGRHRPLGRLRVAGLVWRQRRAAIAPEVGTDDRVSLRQACSDAVPGGVRTRMTVQQHHRWPFASPPEAKNHLAQVQVFERETVKHAS
jgi:hypothetical protein